MKTMSAIGFSRLLAGGIELDTSPENFGFLSDSTEWLGNPEALRARMEQDGYLFLPGFLDREEVKGARHAICQTLLAEGLLEDNSPPDAALAKAGIDPYFRPDIANGPESGKLIRNVIYGGRMMAFFDCFLGGKSTHYDYTWMRSVAPGKGTYPHCDVVYMGRGTKNLYTAWVPFGDVSLEVGGLILIEGSHHNERLRNTYCTLDVDTACQNRSNESELNAAGYPGFGALSFDLRSTREAVGGRLLTAKEFRMGDVLIFSIFTVHGSLDNQSKEIRLSTDSRYQLASEPLDERWVGEAPPAHGGNSIKGMIC
jgi:hypothetical protein